MHTEIIEKKNNNFITLLEKFLYVDLLCVNFSINMTYIILFLLGLIVYNLVAGFVYILKDKSASNRGFHSLRTRIILSLNCDFMKKDLFKL